MADKQFDLVFNAKMEVDNVRKAVAQIGKLLDSADVKLPQSISGNLGKLVTSLKRELDALSSISGAELEVGDAKKVAKSVDKINFEFTQLLGLVREVSSEASKGMEHFFPKSVTTNIEKATKALERYRDALADGPKDSTFKDNAAKIVAREQKKADREASRAELRGKIQAQEQVAKTAKAAATAEKTRATKEVNKAQSELDAVEAKIKAQEELIKQEGKVEQLRKKREEREKAQARHNRDYSPDGLLRQKNAQTDVNNTKNHNTKVYKNARDYLDSVAANDAALQRLDTEIAQLEQDVQKYQDYSQELETARQKVAAAEVFKSKVEGGKTDIAKKSADEAKALVDLNGQYTANEAAIAGLDKEIQNLTATQNQAVAAFNKSAFEALVKDLKTLGIEIPDTVTNFDQLQQAVEDFKAANLQKTEQAVEGIGAAAQGATGEVKKLVNAGKETGDMADSVRRAEQEISRLKDNILEFFSINNAISLFKRTLNSAIETVTELDAAMTETAVVTDFSIGDMWDKLPTYSKQASALGASIVDLYDATTLYYQQGLNTQQSMAIGTETMKMARIANMEGAEATEAMTAALRGFNMELNEVSATRINDVYSELAAITAADTSQIATAMGKTASIASSANMEFETTAALLAQIIETTQEAPETAGTAMKTIIARFTEVKELYDEGMLSGTDSEGETIEINKIDKALRKVGISLTDFISGKKGIDEILLELASKWDSLDLATQRYIATTAAGSRQQSRFLAMMSDYDRTVELVNAASSSAGASTEQFNKTLDSLRAKTTKLQNAWAEFTMGIANDDLIKAGVDALIWLLEAINNLTTWGGKIDGLTSSILKLGVSIVALSSGAAIFNSLSKSWASLADAKGIGIIEKVIQTFVISGKNAGSSLVTTFTKAKGAITAFSTAVAKAGGGLAGFKTVIITAIGSISTMAATIAAVIVVVAALVIGIIALEKAIDKANHEAELDNLEKSVNSLKESVEETQKEISELASAEEQFNAMQNRFEELTKGTDEWNQALISANQQVLELIEMFPDLKSGLELGEYGQLVITADAWGEAARVRADEVSRLTTAAQVAEYQINNVRNEMEIASAFGEQYKWYVEQARAMDAGGIAGWWAGTKLTGKTYSPMKQLMTQKTAEESAEIIHMGGLTEDELFDVLLKAGQEGIMMNDSGEIETNVDLQELYNAAKSQNIYGSYNEFIQALKKLEPEKFNGLVQDILDGYKTGQAQQAALIASSVSANEEAVATGQAEAISNIMTKNLKYGDYEEVYEEIEVELNNQLKTQDIEEIYSKELGIGYYENGKLYTDESKETEFTGKTATDMKNEIIAARLTNGLEAEIEEVVNAIEQMTSEERDLFGQVFSTNGSDLTMSTLAKYTNNGIWTEESANALMSDLGYDSVTQMADALKVSKDDLIAVITSGFEEARNRINKARADTGVKMARYRSRDGGDVNKDTAEALAMLETKFGEAFRDTINGVIGSLELSGDDSLISGAYQKFEAIALAESTSLEDINELANFVQDVNWNSPIDAVEQLNQEIKYGTGLTKDYAEHIMEISNHALSASSQWAALGKTEDYADLREELEEILSVNDEISASDVDNLRGSYAALDKMLKNTKMSAMGVAKALTEIGKGNANIDNLNDVVLAALEHFDTLNSYIHETKSALDKFDPGIDEGEFGDQAKDWGEQGLERAEAGEIGNTQSRNILNAFYGDNWDAGISNAQDMQKRQVELFTQMSKGDNLAWVWKQFASNYAQGKNFFGEAIDPALLEQGIAVTDTGSGISIDNLPDDWGTNEFAQWWEAVSGLGELGAQMALSDMKNYSYGMTDVLNAKDYDHAIEAAALQLTNYSKQLVDIEASKAAHDRVTDNYSATLIDESELKLLSNILGVSTEKILADLQQQTGKTITTTNYYDDEGQLKLWSGQDGLKSEFDKAMGEGFSDQWISNLTSSARDANNAMTKALDVDAIRKQLEDLNIPVTKIEDVTNQIVSEFVTNTTDAITQIKTKAYDGSEITIPITPEMSTADIQAAINAENEKLKLDNFMTALSETPLKITIDGQEVETQVGELKQQISGEPVPMQVQLEGNLDEVLPPAEVGTYIKYTTNGFSVPASQYNVRINYTATGDVPNGNGSSTTTGGGGTTGGTTGGGKNTNTVVRVATGTNGPAPSSFPALVGDGDGPELILRNNGTAQLSGVNGPEFTNIGKGETVYTAEQTRQIYKNSGNTMPTYSRFGNGWDSYNTGTAYGGSGSGSGSDDEPWENPYDKLYNLVRKIDEELRERERIERRYEKLLTDLNTSANKIISVSREELDQLKREQMLQEQLVQGRRNQIEQWQQENADMTKYGNVVTNDRGESVLRINWDLINSVTDSEHGADIEDYISKLEEWFDSLQEAEDALWDIEDTIDEIKERGEEEYFELEDKIKEAVTQAYQDEIDELSAINDSINDTNSNLLDAIQKSIDKQRQDRDNQRTEDDLAEKQRRLLYLSQNTSGANQMEIMQLQKELEEGTEDYTDTLIDQKISELQEQNDEAATQREQQIDLLQAQLDHYVDTGEIWNEVYQLMESGLDPDGGLIRGSRLEEILKNADNFSGLSAIGKQEWYVDLNNMIAQALAYLEIGRQLEDIGVAAGTQIQFTDKNGNVLTGTVDEEGNVTTADGTVYNNVFQGADGKYYAGENLEEPETPTVEGPSEGSGGGGSSQQTNRNPYGKISDVGFLRYYSGSQMMTGNKVKILQWALNDMGYDTGGIDGKFGYMTHTAVMQFQGSAGLPRDGHVGPDTRNAMAMRGYKTGGLADFTGPAWLDGTKARPELVLNQRDTQNFIQLKDILSDVMTRMGSTSNSTENNGDTTYDIDINVESIGSDYDMDQMASYIKNMIITDARYRNNNVVSLKR